MENKKYAISKANRIKAIITANLNHISNYNLLAFYDLINNLKKYGKALTCNSDIITFLDLYNIDYTINMYDNSVVEV